MEQNQEQKPATHVALPVRFIKDLSKYLESQIYKDVEPLLTAIQQEAIPLHLSPRNAADAGESPGDVAQPQKGPQKPQKSE